jgi:hypothetical protein
VVGYACNPSMQEAKAGGSRFLGQPELHSKTPSQKINKLIKIKMIKVLRVFHLNRWASKMPVYLNCDNQCVLGSKLPMFHTLIHSQSEFDVQWVGETSL